jgi:hypothetical protein
VKGRQHSSRNNPLDDGDLAAVLRPAFEEVGGVLGVADGLATLANRVGTIDRMNPGELLGSAMAQVLGHGGAGQR